MGFVPQKQYSISLHQQGLAMQTLSGTVTRGRSWTSAEKLSVSYLWRGQRGAQIVFEVVG